MTSHRTAYGERVAMLIQLSRDRHVFSFTRFDWRGEIACSAAKRCRPAWRRIGNRPRPIPSWSCRKSKRCGFTVSAINILQGCTQHLPAYMVPQDVVELRRMPFNANGKVDYPALQRLARDGDLSAA